MRMFQGQKTKDSTYTQNMKTETMVQANFSVGKDRLTKVVCGNVKSSESYQMKAMTTWT